MADEKLDNGQGPGDNVELENLRKDSAGKDRKVTELMATVKDLEQRLQAAGGDVEARIEDAARFRELVGRIKEREAGVDAQEKALRVAIERGLPPTLATRNAANLDELLAELAEYETTLAKRNRKVSRVVDPGGKVRLTFSDVSRFSCSEIARIPSHILERLEGLSNG